MLPKVLTKGAFVPLSSFGAQLSLERGHLKMTLYECMLNIVWNQHWYNDTENHDVEVEKSNGDIGFPFNIVMQVIIQLSVSVQPKDVCL